MSTGLVRSEEEAPVAVIRVAGALADRIVVSGVHSWCGELTDDLSCHFAYEDPTVRPGMRGGWVMSWDDLEAAYLAIKTLRETPPNEGTDG